VFRPNWKMEASSPKLDPADLSPGWLAGGQPVTVSSCVTICGAMQQDEAGLHFYRISTCLAGILLVEGFI
jgi:hypothetical protein